MALILMKANMASSISFQKYEINDRLPAFIIPVKNHCINNNHCLGVFRYTFLRDYFEAKTESSELTEVTYTQVEKILENTEATECKHF